jgi:hypothetical protein
MAVDITALAMARISELRRAESISPLLNSSLYQRRENPAKTPVLAVLLNEKRIRTAMGA